MHCPRFSFIAETGEGFVYIVEIQSRFIPFTSEQNPYFFP